MKNVLIITGMVAISVLSIAATLNQKAKAQTKPRASQEMHCCLPPACPPSCPDSAKKP